MNKLIKKFQKGNFINNTGKTNQQIYNTLTPAGGFDFLSLIGLKYDWNTRSGNEPRKGVGYKATPDEELYWKKYLELDNIEVPKMNPKAKTEWDDSVEKDLKIKSTFVGTTPNMDKLIQAIADTTNTGKIVRNYDFYKSKNPKLPNKNTINNIYNFGKDLLNNSNTWKQANESLSIKPISSTSEYTGGSGLGALQNFGLKWNPKTRNIYMHDTYNFPDKILWENISKYIPKRLSELKIRSVVNLPENGSYLLRNDLENYNE